MEYRKDNTRILSSKGQTPRLGAKLLKDGRESLYLETTLDGGKVNGKRKQVLHRESLYLYLLTGKLTRVQQEYNKETLRLAWDKQHEKSIQIEEQRANVIRAKKTRLIDLIDERQPVKTAINNLCIFLEKMGYDRRTVTANQITPQIANQYYIWLRSKGGTYGSAYIQRLKTYFSRLKNYGYVSVNSFESIKQAKVVGVRKNILTEKEIRILCESVKGKDCTDIQRAFILSLNTGLRFCDIKDLTNENIDNGILTVKQKKIEGCRNDIVRIPIDNELVRALQLDKAGKLFRLTVCKTYIGEQLNKWTQSVGISKRISFHCARHSFAVLLLSKGVDIYTVSKLMGHSSISMTEQYLHLLNNSKEKAIQKLPKIF